MFCSETPKVVSEDDELRRKDQFDILVYGD